MSFFIPCSLTSDPMQGDKAAARCCLTAIKVPPPEYDGGKIVSHEKRTNIFVRKKTKSGFACYIGQIRIILGGQ